MTDSLRNLAAAASRALSAGTVPPWVLLQLRAGCCTLAACAQLACGAQLQAASAFKIASAFSLIFGPGAALLGLQLDAAEQATTRRSLGPLCDVQLVAVYACTFNTLDSSEQTAAAAAFASSTAKPAALLPWLLATARTLAAVDSQHGEQLNWLWP